MQSSLVRCKAERVYNLADEDFCPCSNHPIDNLEVEDEEVTEVEKLKEEGNEFFVCKRYQKALTKWVTCPTHIMTRLDAILMRVCLCVLTVWCNVRSLPCCRTPVACLKDITPLFGAQDVLCPCRYSQALQLHRRHAPLYR